MDPQPTEHATTSQKGSSFIRRRSLIVGAAWSVPAVVLASASPAFAAASGLTLAFDKSSYSGVGCSTISGATVTASQNGAAKSGASVTVALADGYSFAGGGTSYTGVTGSGGVVSLPAINVPLAGGSSTFSATSSGGSSASASAVGTPAGDAAYIKNGTVVSLPSIPSGATPIWAGGNALYLTTDNRVMDSTGAVLATGVSKFGYPYVDSTDWYIPYSKTDGSIGFLKNGTPTAVGGAANSSPIWAGSYALYLSPAGQVFDSSGKIYDSNVAAVGRPYLDSTDWYMPYRRSDGSAWYLRSGVPTAMGGAVPANSKPIWAGGYALYLTTNNDVINSGGGLLATGVASCGDSYLDGGDWYVPYVTTGGTLGFLKNGVSFSGASSPGATPLWAGGNALFLDTNNRIVNVNGTVIATGISSVGKSYVEGSDWYLPYIKSDGTAGYLKNGTPTPQPSVPLNSQAVWAGANALFLTPSYQIVNGSGVVLATGISATGRPFVQGADWYVPYVKTDGTAGYLKDGTPSAVLGAVPLNSVPVWAGGNAIFLTPSKALVDATGTVLISNVSSVGEPFVDTDGTWYLPYLLGDGTDGYLKNGTPRTPFPDNSTPIWGAAGCLFLTPGGDIVVAGDPTPKASGVSKVGQPYTDGTDTYVPYVKTDGSAGVLKNLSTLSFSGVPSNSSPIWAGVGALFLTPSKSIVNGSGSELVKNVNAYGEAYVSGSDWYLPISVQPASC